MKKRILVLGLGLGLALSSCAVLDPIVEATTGSSRETLARMEQYKCKIAPIGTVEWYFNTPELLRARMVICNRGITFSENSLLMRQKAIQNDK